MSKIIFLDHDGRLLKKADRDIIIAKIATGTIDTTKYELLHTVVEKRTHKVLSVPASWVIEQETYKQSKKRAVELIKICPHNLSISDTKYTQVLKKIKHREVYWVIRLSDRNAIKYHPVIMIQETLKQYNHG